MTNPTSVGVAREPKLRTRNLVAKGKLTERDAIELERFRDFLRDPAHRGAPAATYAKHYEGRAAIAAAKDQAPEAKK